MTCLDQLQNVCCVCSGWQSSLIGVYFITIALNSFDHEFVTSFHPLSILSKWKKLNCTLPPSLSLVSLSLSLSLSVEQFRLLQFVISALWDCCVVFQLCIARLFFWNFSTSRTHFTLFEKCTRVQIVSFWWLHCVCCNANTTTFHRAVPY
jgi:hypothetical protein